MKELIIEGSKKYPVEQLFDKYRKTTIKAVQTGKISHQDYKDFWDTFDSVQPEFSKRNFRRKDYRTLGQFALDLFLNADKETSNFSSWWNKHGVKYFGNMTYESYGADASGMLLFASDPLRGNPDFILSDESKVEYKINNRNTRTATYKMADLRSYESFGCYVLTEFIIEGKNHGYVLMTPEDIKGMLRAAENKKIEIFNFRGMGFKPCVQFYVTEKSGTERQSVPLRDYCEQVFVS
jgi:hypothetical protein